MHKAVERRPRRRHDQLHYTLKPDLTAMMKAMGLSHVLQWIGGDGRVNMRARKIWIIWIWPTH